MQKKIKSLLPEFFLVTGCVAVCAVSLFMFWKDLNASSTRKDKNQIAVIEYKYKVAQRKYNDRVVWERLQQNSPLYNSDTIRTADMSEARIIFNDNAAVIELHENSMIQIFYDEKKGVSLSVDEGGIDVDTTSNESESTVSVALQNGSVVELASGSKASASSNDSGENSIKLSAGNADIKKSDGKKTSVGAGEAVKVDSSGEVKKSAVTVTSIPETTRVLNFGNNKMPVNIVWNTSAEFDESEFVIETSFDKNFSTVYESYERVGSSNLTVDSPGGTLYWRIYPKNKPSEISSGKISVDSVTPIKINSPVNGSEFTYRNKKPQILFNWTGNDFADHYRIEISQYADLSHPLINEEIYSTRYSTSEIPEGSYFWRITPYYSINKTGWAEPTAVSSFYIKKNQALLPPLLTVPSDKTKITLSEKESKISFMWKSDVKDADFKFIISDTPEFKKTIFETETKTNRLQKEFTISQLPAGTYYWKILRSSEEDEGSVYSEPKCFVIEKYIPGENKLIYPPDNYSVEEKKLKSTSFMYRLSDEYKDNKPSVKIQFSKTSDFSNVQKEIISETASTKNISLECGVWYWRIGAQSDVFGKQFNYTSARIVNVLSELSAPVITSPSENEELIAFSKKPAVISWNEISGADYYSVKIFNALTDELVNEFDSVKDNSVRVNLPGGKEGDAAGIKYRVAVQSFASETDYSPMRTGNVSSREFRIRTLRHSEIISPLNEKTDGLDAIRKGVTLRWRNGERSSSTTIIVQKLQPNGTYKTVETVSDAGNSYTLERLTEGTYQWKIISSTSGGIPLDSHEAGRFTVLPVPELSLPVLQSPENKFTVNLKYLKGSRFINFSWKNIPDATDYTFVLYKKNDDGSLRKIYEQKKITSTAIKFKEISSLENGNFVWNVTAYTHAEDGYEEMHSKTSSGYFTVDVQMPKKIKINSPGKMYGE